MTSNCNYRDCSKTSHFLYLWSKSSYLCTRVYHFAKLATLQAYTLYERIVEVVSAGVEHLRCRSDSIFAYSLTCEHIAKGIWHKQYLICIFECHILCLLHSIKLEQGVEVHKLYTSNIINFFLRHTFIEIFLHLTEGVRIAISKRVAQYATILVYAYEIYAPSIDTDALDFDFLLCYELQSFNNLIIQSVDIPIEMSTSLNKVIIKASKLFEHHLSIFDSTYDSSAACSTKVDSKEMFWLFHLYG